jgi:two-component system LytT family sensor kinase
MTGGLSWRLVAGVGAAYSLFAALVSYGFTRLTGRSLWTLAPDATANFGYILAMNLVLWGSWGLFVPIVFALGRRFTFDRRGWRRALLVHLPAAGAITVAHIVVVATGRQLLQRGWGVDVEWLSAVGDAFFRTLDFELPVYWAILGLQHALDYYREVRAREVAAATLETRLVEAQLQALQCQLHPHFLFNTLHAISALVHRQPDKADEMIERLSDLLRITLDKVSVQEVTVAEEIEYLRAYLDIEQVHFGDRLEIVYRIDAHALDALVPNLILQPLAENAIRHGLAPVVGKGRLSIEAMVEDQTLVLRVADDGLGLGPDGIAERVGVGLSNTQARLERLHARRATLECAPGRGRGCVVTVRMPLRVQIDGGEQSGESREPRERGGGPWPIAAAALVSGIGGTGAAARRSGR